MIVENFDLMKRNALTKLDKSSKEGIDNRIESLCNTINNREDMFTLSSCSGRVSIKRVGEELKKTKNIWIFMSHEKIEGEYIMEIIDGCGEKDLDFCTEGAIVHISCRSLDIAKELLILAKEAGFNQSGLISWNKKIVLEINVDSVINFPIKRDGKRIVDDKFIDNVVNMSNSCLNRSRESIDKLESKILDIL